MSATLVTTRYGKLEGIKEGAVSVWKGIPYAEAPLNALRFRAPKQPKSWEGVREAKNFGPAALQSEREVMKFLGDCPTKKSEDCLYLNIWSPGADDRRRPVMVWIHGGSFMYGSGSSSLYDGKSFAEKGDVVVITINYRLGVFGFLHLSEIGGEIYNESGNCGLLDQAAALKWVNENIEAFGGDPNNVTIFGESAGSVSVGCLLTMPSVKGFFSKAILQSGTATHTLPTASASKVTEQLLTGLQIGQGELSKLESIPAETLLKAAEIFPPRSFGPVADDVTISRESEKKLSDGFAKDIPILIGTTADEWRLFTIFDPIWQQMNENALTEICKQSFGPLWSEISKRLMKKETLNQTLYEHAMTYHAFTFPAMRFSEGQAKHDAPIWMYRFDYRSTGLDGSLRACHALEVPFVWNNLMKTGIDKFTGDAPERHQLANQIHRAWIAFAHHSNPNTSELPNWPRYDLEERSVMLFNVESKIMNDPEEQMRLIWENSTRKQEVNL